MAASRYAAARSTRVCHSSGLMSAGGRGARSVATGFCCRARSASFSAITLSLSVAGSDQFCAGPVAPLDRARRIIFAQDLTRFKRAEARVTGKETSRAPWHRGLTVTVAVARYLECMNKVGKPPYRTLPPAPDALVEHLEGA